MKQKKELNYVGADASAFINVDQFISWNLTNRLSNTPPRQAKLGEKGKSGHLLFLGCTMDKQNYHI